MPFVARLDRRPGRGGGRARRRRHPGRRRRAPGRLQVRRRLGRAAAAHLRRRTSPAPSVLLEAMAAAGVDKVVFSSSAAVYGTPDVDLVTEETPHAPGVAVRRVQADRRVAARATRAAATRPAAHVAALLQRRRLGDAGRLRHSARTTSSRSSSRRSPRGGRRGSTATTTRPRTAPASATTSTSPTSPSRTSRRPRPSTRARRSSRSTTSAAATGSRSARSWTAIRRVTGIDFTPELARRAPGRPGPHRRLRRARRPRPRLADAAHRRRHGEVRRGVLASAPRTPTDAVTTPQAGAVAAETPDVESSVTQESEDLDESFFRCRGTGDRPMPRWSTTDLDEAGSVHRIDRGSGRAGTRRKNDSPRSSDSSVTADPRPGVLRGTCTRPRHLHHVSRCAKSRGQDSQADLTMSSTVCRIAQSEVARGQLRRRPRCAPGRRGGGRRARARTRCRSPAAIAAMISQHATARRRCRGCRPAPAGARRRAPPPPRRARPRRRRRGRSRGRRTRPASGSRSPDDRGVRPRPAPAARREQVVRADDVPESGIRRAHDVEVAQRRVPSDGAPATGRGCSRSPMRFDSPYGDSGACGVSSVTRSTSGVPNTAADAEKTSRGDAGGSHPLEQHDGPAHVAAVGLQRAVDRHPGVLEAGQVHDPVDLPRRPARPPRRPGRRPTRDERHVRRHERRRCPLDRSSSTTTSPAARAQRARHVRADVAGPAGHQPGRHVNVLPVSRSYASTYRARVALDDVVGQRRRRRPDARSHPLAGDVSQSRTNCLSNDGCGVPGLPQVGRPEPGRVGGQHLVGEHDRAVRAPPPNSSLVSARIMPRSRAISSAAA